MGRWWRESSVELPEVSTTMNWSKQALLRALCSCLLVLSIPLHAAIVTGEIVDAKSGELIPARLYIQADAGSWHFAQSASPSGSAIRYEKQNWINTNAVEMHVTLSAHPFRAD